MKYDAPRAEMVVLSTDPIMGSLDVENALGFWDIFGEKEDTFRAENSLSVWDMLNQ